MVPDPSVAEPDWTACEPTIKRFEAAWREQERPDLEAFLPAGAPRRLIAEIAHIDLEFRIRAGDAARVEEYLDRYQPSLIDREVILDLITTEYVQRNRYAPPAWPEEYWLRFPEYINELRELLSEDYRPAGLTSTRPHCRPAAFAGVPSIPGYEILDVLGRGGMGVVYRARHVALDRIVAVKTFAHPPGETELNRFRREAEAIARLDCPNVVPVYQIGEWQPAGGGQLVPYFVMKWYPGGSLATAPAGPGTDLSAHARMVETLARAVHHAHQRGILHRDLKPSNILLDEKGEPHVADFGLAGRMGADATATGSIVGTPSYMAPEQARSPNLVTTAADVYGLGAVLYHMLTGEPPFRADTALATLDQVANCRPTRPALCNAAVPRDLETICMKCLEKDPNRRYSCADLVADDLARFLAGRPILARPVSTWEYTRRLVARHPLLSSMAAVTLLALVASVVTLAVSNTRISGKEQETAAALDRERHALVELSAALTRERDLHYSERVGLAGQLWQAGETEAASRLLDLCPHEQRGWEWNYLAGLRHSEPVLIGGPGVDSNSVSLGPKGQVAIGDRTGMVTIWDRLTGKHVHSLRVSDRPIQHVLLLPDGKTLLATANAEGMTAWDLTTFTLRFKADAGRRVAVNADGTVIAAPGRTALRLYDVATGQQLREFPMPLSGYMAVAFSPDGRRIAVAGRAVRVFDLATASFIGPARERTLPVSDLAFSTDGHTLIEAESTSIYITDPETGVVRSQWESVGLGRVRVAVSTQGNRLATLGPGRTIRVRDLDHNRDVFTSPPIPQIITDIDLSSDGRFLAACGINQPVRIWDLDREADMLTIARVGNRGGAVSVGEGGRVAVARETDPGLGPTTEEIVVLSEDGRIEARLAGAGVVAFGPRGRLAFGGREAGIKVWDPVTGRVEPEGPALGQIVSLTYSADGRYIAAASDCDGVVVWPAGTSAGVHLTSGHTRVTALSFHHSGERLAVAGEGGPTCLFDIATGTRLNTFGAIDGSPAVAFSPKDSLIAIVDPDRSVRLRDSETSRSIIHLDGHGGDITSITFSSDGRRVLTISTDRIVRVFDARTGSLLIALPGLTGPGRSCAWSTDGTKIFVTDNALRVWEAKPLPQSAGVAERLGSRLAEGE